MCLKFQRVAPSIFEDKISQFDKTVLLSWNLIYCTKEWKTDGMLLETKIRRQDSDTENYILGMEM